ncbi:MAG TPA: GNAT family N-acetyltransferase [Chthoniobacteraceae bacterium]|jgi:hypothetical protein|nr:GNAT family N-acetyltransferase [Chthoniobacteraceae bacterium]
MKPPQNPLRHLHGKLRAMKEQHEERHRPTGFGFAQADRIDYLDGALWDAVAAHGSVFMARPVLRAMESAGPENVMPRYILIFRGARPVAAVVAQVVTVNGSQMRRKNEASGSGGAKGLMKRLLGPAAAKAADGWKDRFVVAGNLMSWGCHGVAFVPGEDAAELWAGVAEALYRVRRAERLSGETNLAMVKDLTPAQSGVETLKRFSYRPLATEPNMVLDLDPAWRSYEDYLAALDAKYRRKVKDIVKKLAGAGCQVESLAGDLAAEADRLHELYLAVQGNAAVRLVTLPPAYLPAMAGALGEAFRCTTIRQEGRIVGFVTSIRDGDTAIGYYIGFDRTLAADGLPIYLQLLHATIADAIHWRCRRLSLGRTALEPKAGLGAKPEPMSVWVRHRVPAMNWLLQGVLGTVPHSEAPERNPFKAGG